MENAYNPSNTLPLQAEQLSRTAAWNNVESEPESHPSRLWDVVEAFFMLLLSIVFVVDFAIREFRRSRVSMVLLALSLGAISCGSAPAEPRCNVLRTDTVKLPSTTNPAESLTVVLQFKACAVRAGT